MALRTTLREIRERILKTRRIKAKSTILKKIFGPLVVIQLTVLSFQVLRRLARTSPLMRPIVTSPVTSKSSCRKSVVSISRDSIIWAVVYRFATWPSSR